MFMLVGDKVVFQGFPTVLKLLDSEEQGYRIYSEIKSYTTVLTKDDMDKILKEEGLYLVGEMHIVKESNLHNESVITFYSPCLLKELIRFIDVYDSEEIYPEPEEYAVLKVGDIRWKFQFMSTPLDTPCRPTLVVGRVKEDDDAITGENLVMSAPASVLDTFYKVISEFKALHDADILSVDLINKMGLTFSAGEVLLLKSVNDGKSIYRAISQDGRETEGPLEGLENVMRFLTDHLIWRQICYKTQIELLSKLDENFYDLGRAGLSPIAMYRLGKLVKLTELTSEINEYLGLLVEQLSENGDIEIEIDDDDQIH